MAVSLKDVAERAGVHLSTVSLALRGSPKISSRTAEDIRKVAEDLGYVPNLMARGLTGAGTKTIGVLVPKLRDSFVIDCVGAQERWMQASGYTPLLTITHGKAEAELKAIDDMIGRGVDGLLFNYIPSSPAVRDRVQSLASQGRIVGLLGSSPELNGVDAVDQHFFTCGYEITKHLLEFGHRKIALAVMSLADERQQARLDGYRKALRELDVPYDPLLVFEIDYVRQDLTQLRKEALSFKERPTAICAYNDDMAADLVMDLMSAGYQVPGDVSVTGVNDGWYSDKLKVPLTTYRLPAEEMGLKLADLLIGRIEDREKGPESVRFGGELVIRESTGRV